MWRQPQAVLLLTSLKPSRRQRVWRLRHSNCFVIRWFFCWESLATCLYSHGRKKKEAPNSQQYFHLQSRCSRYCRPDCEFAVSPGVPGKLVHLAIWWIFMQDSTNVDILFHYCLVRHSGPHIDQYRAIVNPLGRRFTIKITNLAIFVIWIFSALITLPFNFALTLVESKRGPVCTDAWPSAEFERFYFVCLSVVQFVIPMTIIASCYILICSHLNSSTRLNDITSTWSNAMKRWENAIYTISHLFYALLTFYDISLCIFSINLFFQTDKCFLRLYVFKRLFFFF